MSAKRVLLTAVLCLGLIFGFFQGVSAQPEMFVEYSPLGKIKHFLIPIVARIQWGMGGQRSHLA